MYGHTHRCSRAGCTCLIWDKLPRKKAAAFFLHRCHCFIYCGAIAIAIGIYVPLPWFKFDTTVVNVINVGDAMVAHAKQSRSDLFHLLHWLQFILWSLQHS